MSFYTLPVELQEKILAENPEMIGRYPLLSKEIRSVISREYYMKLCNKDISKYELIKYINSLSEDLNSIGLSASRENYKSIRQYLNRINFKNGEIQAKFYIKQQNGMYELVNLYLMYYQPDDAYNLGTEIQSNISFQQLKADLLDFANKNMKVRIDIFNMFNVLDRRKFCLEINENYNYHFVLDYINKLYDIVEFDTITENGLDVFFYFLINDMIMDKELRFYWLHISNQEAETEEERYPYLEMIDRIYTKLINYLQQLKIR